MFNSIPFFHRSLLNSGEVFPCIIKFSKSKENEHLYPTSE
jgi:hypothetical protein